MCAFVWKCFSQCVKIKWPTFPGHSSNCIFLYKNVCHHHPYHHNNNNNNNNNSNNNIIIIIIIIINSITIVIIIIKKLIILVPKHPSTVVSCHERLFENVGIDSTVYTSIGWLNYSLTLWWILGELLSTCSLPLEFGCSPCSKTKRTNRSVCFEAHVYSLPHLW